MKFDSLREAMQDYLSEANVSSIEDMTEAILDGHSIPDLGDLSFLVGCTRLGYLSINKCDIKSLSVFPEGLVIERLELCDNKLSDGLESLAALSSLEELHLGGNKFATAESLSPLAQLKSLRILDVTDCPITKDASLHATIFGMVPTLEAFNGKDEANESVDFEDGSSDFDDYSDEDSDSGSGSEEDQDDEDDENDDEEDDEDAESDEDGSSSEDDDDSERPTKTARHD
jgi:acidic leucine-rich nuclear phosphoprotein 32 family protein E